MKPRPFRVLMTLDAVGGVWRYATDLGRGLRDAGVAVHFLGFGPRPDARRAAEARGTGPLDWAEAPLDWTAEGPEALSAVPGIIAEAAARAGADLVHANLPTQVAGLHAPCPALVVSHSCVPTWFHAVRGSTPPADWAWHAELNARGLSAADMAITPSAAQADLLRRCYGPLPALRVVPNGSDAALAPSPRGDAVVAAGRWWDEGKNGAVLDTAAARIRAPVRMIGATRPPSGGGLRLRHAVAVGELSRTETLAEMARAAVFVAPSLYEPFGLAALEAARAGTPLVLADIPTFRELWEGAALFFPPRDPEALAAAVERLRADPDLRANLSEAARDRAADFTLARQTEAMLALYAELCPGRVSSGRRAAEPLLAS